MKNNNNRISALIFKVVAGFLCAFSMFQYCGFYSMASIDNIGKNFSGWFLDQLFWIAIVVVIGFCLVLYSKKAYTQLVIFAIAGTVVLVFIKNPTLLETIGNNAFKIFMK